MEAGRPPGDVVGDAPTSRAARFPAAAFVAVVLWGGSFVATRRALEAFTPQGLVFLRLAIALPLLTAFLRLRGAPYLPAGRDLRTGLWLGLILALHMGIQAHGLLHTSAIHTGWIIGFTPAAIAVGAWLFRGERLGRLGWAGVALASAGVLFVTLEQLPELARARWGDLLQLSTCLTWTAYTLLGASAVARSGAVRMTVVAMGVAALGLLPLLVVSASTFSEGPSWRAAFLRARPGAVELLALAFLGCLCSALAMVLWYRSQRRHGSQRTAALLYLEPFVALAVGVAVGGEQAGLQAVIGGTTVVAGVALTSFARS